MFANYMLDVVWSLQVLIIVVGSGRSNSGHRSGRHNVAHLSCGRQNRPHTPIPHAQGLFEHNVCTHGPSPQHAHKVAKVLAHKVAKILAHTMAKSLAHKVPTRWHKVVLNTRICSIGYRQYRV